MASLVAGARLLGHVGLRSCDSRAREHRLSSCVAQAEFALWHVGSSQKNCNLLSLVRLFATPWTAQPTEFSRRQYWSGEPFPFSSVSSNPGIEPRSPAWEADFFPAEPPGKPGDLPGPRIKRKSPALAGGFFTTGPPRKSLVYLLKMKTGCAYLGIMQVWFHTVYVNLVTRMLWVPSACKSDAYTWLQSSKRAIALCLHKECPGTLLVVQWLRLHAPKAGGPGAVLSAGPRPHMLQLLYHNWDFSWPEKWMNIFF